jgi:hypothetical protein
MKVCRNRYVSALVKLILLGVFFGITGCVRVQPWERGTLAKKEMSMNPNPNLSKFRDHVFNSKESSIGGHTGGGGGCGCN